MMFDWETEDGEHHHYRVGVEATWSECITPSDIAQPCLTDDHVATSEPLLRSLLGDNLFAYLGDVFADQQAVDEATQSNTQAEIEHCQLVHQFRYQKDLNNRFVFSTVYTTFVLIILVLVVIILLKRIRRRRMIKSIHNGRAEGNVCSNEVSSDVNMTAKESHSIYPAHSSSEIFAGPESDNAKDTAHCSGIHLSYQLNIANFHSQIPTKSLNTAEFLRNAVDKLFSELDTLLLKNVNDGSTSQIALSTPRLSRRNDRRGRVGSSPSLPSPDQMSTDDSQTSDTKEQVQAWNELKAFARDINWQEPHTLNVDETKLDRSGLRLLHYFQRVCPINADQWNASALLTNFTLILLNKELEGLSSKIGYRCITFKGTGSAKDGTKVCKSNQFDVYMEMQPPNDVVPTSVIEKSKTESIPPGRFLIACKLRERSVHVSSTMVSKAMKKIHVDGIDPQLCLSSKEMARSAEELIDNCLQNLYSKYRSLADRLPFQIKRAVVPNLVLSLDTKNIVGIGIPEIKINLIPVALLPFEGWYQSVKLYATPLLEMHEYKHKSETNNVICPDYFWHVASGDINDVFQLGVQNRMRYAGIHSCHLICLMILKSLLTGGVKSSLLDRGEFQTLHISTCLNFLLLESQPEQWRVDQIVHRFSDCVHFLRDSFTNGRLPNFFINNPYLIDKMPVIRTLPLLTRKRQENLLSDMRTGALEKCLRFLDESLRESGLADCVQHEYSHDMWEYEFFVFN